MLVILLSSFVLLFFAISWLIFLIYFYEKKKVCDLIQTESGTIIPGHDFGHGYFGNRSKYQDEYGRVRTLKETDANYVPRLRFVDTNNI